MNRFSADKHKYFRRSSDRFFFLFGLLMLCSEIWKQLTLTFLVGHGVYTLWYFPFQLCSIPMYVFLILPFARGEKVRRALLCFIMCYALLGGTAVFADTSGLHYSYAPLTVHSYLWHFLMIGTALFSGINCARELKSGQEKAGTSGSLSAKTGSAESGAAAGVSRLPLCAFAGSTVLYLTCCLIATGINVTLDKYGTINMFYINPDYPMQQVVFRDIAARTGNLPSIFIYIGATILGAFILFLIWNGIFRILHVTERRSDRSDFKKNF